MTLGKKVPGGVECLYEFNLLHHVVVVAKRVCAAAETAHEGDDNTPSGPMGRGVKKIFKIEEVSILKQGRPHSARD